MHAAPVEHSDLKLGSRDLRALVIGLPRQRGCGHAQGTCQRHPLGESPLDCSRHLIGVAAHHHEAVLVGHRAIKGDPVDLVAVGRLPYLCDDDLHLEWLVAFRENGAK